MAVLGSWGLGDLGAGVGGVGGLALKGEGGVGKGGGWWWDGGGMG